ncbi:MAG: CAAX prenyl protease-related protein [Planctomycetota bacterium]
MCEPSKGSNVGASRESAGRRAVLRRHRWLTFVLPMAVFMLVGSLEPKPPTPGAPDGWLAIPYQYYPIVYTLKIALTVAAILFVLPGYREFPFRVSPLAVLVGALGVVIWVGTCSLGLEQRLLTPLGLGRFLGLGARSAFDPFVELRIYPAAWAWGFLAVRFLGLVAVVAVIEEFFLRGFLMRFVLQADWWEVPFGKVNAISVIVATVVPMFMHPAELFAALLWFSLVTWLMVKTKNIWDCVAAHAVTNLLLGVYVVSSGQWQLM